MVNGEWGMVFCRRDNYFGLMKMCIEQLYDTTGKPVILLAHSMGNRVTHYFLNYMKKQPDSQAWLKKYVYLFLAVR
jgi:esterase/lipase superfamily enzyme